jgi:polyhydroxyalkanoate synthesis repressor PhaR
MTQAALPILIKQYGGGRLYDTDAGRYVTIDALADLMRDGHALVIRDARSGEDITSATLKQLRIRER